MNLKHVNTKYILVVGGAGYIGSQVCKSLSKKGYTPITFDNLSTGHHWAIKWGPFEHGCMSDHQKLSGILYKYDPLAIIHLAGYTNVRESSANPAKYYLNNVSGTIALLESIRNYAPIPVLFSSTCAVYDSRAEVSIQENAPLNPINPYGSSKLIIEKILEDFSNAYGTPYVSLRYFNAGGADPDGEIGEHHTPETHLIPLAIHTALGRLPALPIYGKDFSTEDGFAVRDYIHVLDLASAHIKALEYIVETNQNAIFNLGSGKGHSVLQVVNMVEKISGKKIPLKYLSRQLGDPSSLIANIETSEKTLQWRPSYSDLESIIKTAWNWHSKG